MAHIVYGNKNVSKKHEIALKANKARQRIKYALYLSLAANVGLLLWLLLRQ